ncbi:hypothetical protein M885DRAFT_575 [Pelagophyceae sp. CCMP2097]|nr:hypothetical protein M885DRAFT_575 [Pelagophyceae sp. CCMP2097]
MLAKGAVQAFQGRLWRAAAIIDKWERLEAADVAYYVVRGESRPLDLAKYEHGGPSHTPSFLALEWAIVADIDLGSEHMRWLGPARFTVAALRRILCLREYRGRLSYLPMAPKRGYYDASALPRLDECVSFFEIQGRLRTGASEGAPVVFCVWPPAFSNGSFGLAGKRPLGRSRWAAPRRLCGPFALETGPGKAPNCGGATLETVFEALLTVRKERRGGLENV